MTNKKSAEQSKQYEKERRDRLNVAFEKLSSVLPDYDPLNTSSKIDILTKAFEHIKKLEQDISKPSETTVKNLIEKENIRLRMKVQHLSSRIHQLMDLMFSAKIEIPDKLPLTSTYTPSNHCKSIEKGNKNLVVLLKTLCDKSKKNNTIVKNKKQNLKNPEAVNQTKTQKRTSKFYRQKKKIIKVVENCDETFRLTSSCNVISVASNMKPCVTTNISKAVLESNLPSFPITVTNIKPTPAVTKHSLVSIAPSNKVIDIISAPIMATGISSTPPLQSVVPNLNLNLNVGTLTLPSGQLMSVQQPVLFIPQVVPQLVVNRPVTSLVIMENNINVNSNSSFIMKNNLMRETLKNNCRAIYPKIKFDSTKTTFINQKPIPSLNLNFSSSKFCKQHKISSSKDREKKLPRKKDTVRKLARKRLMKNFVRRKRLSRDKKPNYQTEGNSSHKLKEGKKIELNEQNVKRCRNKNKSKIFLKKYIDNDKVVNRSTKEVSFNSLNTMKNKKIDRTFSDRLNQFPITKLDEKRGKDYVCESNLESSIHSSSNITYASTTNNFSTKSVNNNNNINMSDKSNTLEETCFSKVMKNQSEEKIVADFNLKSSSGNMPESISAQISCSTNNVVIPFNSMDPKLVDNFSFSGTKDVLCQLSSYEKNTFLPILPSYLEDVREFTPDILSTFQIPSNVHNSESISPTAAFLLSFPVVSSSKNVELLNENELNCDQPNENSTSILQSGTIDSPSSSVIETQTLLFDTYYSQVSKNQQWLPKISFSNCSVSKAELTQKYGDHTSLHFENPALDLISSSVLNDKKCIETNPKSLITRSKTDQLSHSFNDTKKSYHTGEKETIQKRPRTSDSEIFKSNPSVDFNNTSLIPTAGLGKDLGTSCNNFLPVFSELCQAKNVDKNSHGSSSKLSEKITDQNCEKSKDKVKLDSQNQSENESNSCEKELNSEKNKNKSFKEKYSSSCHNNANELTASNVANVNNVNIINNVSCNNIINTVSNSIYSTNTNNSNSINNVNSITGVTVQTMNSAKPHVNWMTAPDVRAQAADQFAISELLSAQNFDFIPSTSASVNSFSSSNIDQLFEYSTAIENKPQNSCYPVVQSNVWSPNKNSSSLSCIGPHTDTNSFIAPPPLPTLMGDLALGTNSTNCITFDSFKLGSFEMIPESFLNPKVSEYVTNDNLKYLDKNSQSVKSNADNQNPVQVNERYKLKEINCEEPFHVYRKSMTDTSKSQCTKAYSKKPEFSAHDKSQQVNSTNFLSVSQLVEQNQEKLCGSLSNENNFSNPKNSNNLHLKHSNRSNKLCSSSCHSDKEIANNYKHVKKRINLISTNSDSNSSQIQKLNDQSIHTKTNNEDCNSWYQSQKQPSNFEAPLKSNNYSAESLINNDNGHSRIMHCNLNEDNLVKSSSNEPFSGTKLTTQSLPGSFIPASQHHINTQQANTVNNVMVLNNSLTEPHSFSNQLYQPEIMSNVEKSNVNYHCFIPSLQTSSTPKTTSIKQSEPLNSVSNSAAQLESFKAPKEKRPTCKLSTSLKRQPSSAEQNSNMHSCSESHLSQSNVVYSLSASNYLSTDPLFTNMQPSDSNKPDSNSNNGNDLFLRPCVSISDYAPFDDRNFKPSQNILSFTASMITSSNSNVSYLSHASLPNNSLSSNVNNNGGNLTPFRGSVIPSSTAVGFSNNSSNCVPSVIYTNVTLTADTNSSVASYFPSVIPSKSIFISSSSSVSNYLPSFIVSSNKNNNFSNYLSGTDNVSASQKMSVDSLSSKSNFTSISSCSGNYLPSIISTSSVSSSLSTTNLSPVVSSAIFSQSSSLSSYLPSVISTTLSDVNIPNFMMTSSNTLSSNIDNMSNFLPPAIPSLNEVSMHLPLSSVNSISGSNTSSQYLQTPSLTSVSSTNNTSLQFSSSNYLPFPSNSSTSRSSFISKQSNQQNLASNNISSYQQPSFSTSVRAVNSQILPNTPYTSSNYLPVFSSNNLTSTSYLPNFSNTTCLTTSSSNYLPILSSNTPYTSSNYLPVFSSNNLTSTSYLPSFSNTTCLTTSSSNYLPILSSSSSDLPPLPSNYLQLSNCNQVSNTYASVNTSYSSSYLPSLTLPSSNYFPINSNSIVITSCSQFLNTNPNFTSKPNMLPFSVSTASGCSSTQTVNFLKISSASQKSSKKSYKPLSINMKANFSHQSKEANSTGDTLCSDMMKTHHLNCKSNNDTCSRSALKPESYSVSNGVSQKSCSSFIPSKDTYKYETWKGRHCEFEKPSSFEATSKVSGSSVKTNRNITTVVPYGENFMPDHFNNNLLLAENTAYQQMNTSNNFQNRIESTDSTASVSQNYNVEGNVFTAKNVPSTSTAYNLVSNSGSSSLTNFNLSAILPEMNDKVCCF